MPTDDDTVPEVPDESALSQQYGKGFAMLKKMGFKTGTGLGKDGEGIVNPIEVVPLKKGQGVHADGDLGGRKKFSREDLFGKRSRDVGVDEVSSPAPARFITREERLLIEARKEVDRLEEKRGNLEYQLYVLGTSTNVVPEEVHIGGDIDDLLRDLIGSGIFSMASVVAGQTTSEVTDRLEQFSLYLEKLRSKYDTNPLWYDLQVESVIASAVRSLVVVCGNRPVVDLEDDGAEIFDDDIGSDYSLLQIPVLSLVRLLILSDDDFERFVQFDVLPLLGHDKQPVHDLTNTEFDISKNNNLQVTVFLLKNVVSPFVRERIFERCLGSDLVAAAKARPLNWLLDEQRELLEVVPEGRVKDKFLETAIKPLIDRESDDVEVVSKWESVFGVHSELWRAVLVRKAAMMTVVLKRWSGERSVIGNNEKLDRMQNLLKWQTVLPPLVIGCVLVNSGFLPNLAEEVSKVKGEDNLDRATIKRWLDLLAPVCYLSPGRQVLVEMVESLSGSPKKVNHPSVFRPSGPPAGFFSNQASPPPATPGRATLGDVVRARCAAENVTLLPKPGVRENGCQVHRLGGQKSVYWKDESIFLKVDDSEWTEVSLDSLFR